jgi:glycerophosphoryl diester phosphodiesterase
MVTAVFAHRGATAEATENTVAAFLEARALGADGVELDVRVSRDGALVVHHDAAIEGLGRLCDLLVAELPAHVPLLVEALDACQGMTVNVEIKNSPDEPGFDPDQALSRATAAAIVETGWRDRVIVSSFSTAALDAVRAADAGLTLGWLFEWSVEAAPCLAQAVAAGYDAVHPFVTQADEALVDSAHSSGLAVNVWTVNAPADLAAMGALGVDAVITDRPLTALDILRPA